jgi:hypothetical protein
LLIEGEDEEKKKEIEEEEKEKTPPKMSYQYDEVYSFAEWAFDLQQQQQQQQPHQDPSSTHIITSTLFYGVMKEEVDRLVYMDGLMDVHTYKVSIQLPTA